MIADKVYSSRALRAYLRKRGIGHTISEEAGQQQQRHNRSRQDGQPPAVDRQIYRRRNVVERRFNQLKDFRGIATRYDKTATSYKAAVSLASFLLWVPAALASTFVISIVSAAAYALLSLTATSDVAPEWFLGLSCGAGGLLGARLQPHLPEAVLHLLLAALATGVGVLCTVQALG